MGKLEEKLRNFKKYKEAGAVAVFLGVLDILFSYGLESLVL